jgi:methionine biosynthesis protein MetW
MNPHWQERHGGDRNPEERVLRAHGVDQRPHRSELKILCSLIPEGAKVLDLGCGDGSVLAFLKEQRHLDAHGVEIDRANVLGAVRRGLSVYHGDMLEGMGLFPDQFFDVVLCSRTLQEVPQPAAALREMLRVGQRVMVGFHNYGYWRNRLCFLLRGLQPQCGSSSNRWFNSPDIHPMTILAFEEFCEADGIRVLERRFLRRNEKGTVRWRPNLRAEYAMFVIGR